MNKYTSNIYNESRHFTGTEKWYRYNFRLLLTDGVKWLADTLDCYWLIDDIGIYSNEHRQSDYFGVAKFSTPKEGSGLLRIEDGNDNLKSQFSYPYSSLYIDFIKPGDVSSCHELRLFISKADDNFDVLMLPSEY